MKRIIHVLMIGLLFGLLVPGIAVIAQDPLCLGVTRQALSTSETFCSGTGQHQACYGHSNINADLQVGSPPFNTEGDITDITYLESIKLSAFDARTGDWGIAKLRVKADLPSNASDDITILIFGDVELENAVTALPIRTSNSQLPLFSSPNEGATEIASIAGNSEIVATDHFYGTSWVRTELESGEVGWLDATGLADEAEVENLNTAEVDSPFYRPLQAFYFSSSPSEDACQAVPSDGLIIQTPEGNAEVNFLINEVDIQLGSTAFLQAEAGGQMTIRMLEGHAVVTSAGVSQTVTAGKQVSVPMGMDLTPLGPPSQVTDVDANAIDQLPVELLDIPLPATTNLPPNLMDFVLSGSGEVGFVSGGDGTSTPNAGSSSDTPTSLEDGSEVHGWETAPGLDGSVPPGHGGTPPGQGNGTGNGQGNGNGSSNGNGQGNGNGSSNGNGQGGGKD